MSESPLHPIDYLAAALQKARLHTRRMRRQLTLAAEAGDVPAERRAEAHLRTAQTREAHAYQRYARAVLDTYCGPALAIIPLPSLVTPDLLQARSAGDGR